MGKSERTVRQWRSDFLVNREILQYKQGHYQRKGAKSLTRKSISVHQIKVSLILQLVPGWMKSYYPWAWISMKNFKSQFVHPLPWCLHRSFVSKQRRLLWWDDVVQYPENDNWSGISSSWSSPNSRSIPMWCSVTWKNSDNIPWWINFQCKWWSVYNSGVWKVKECYAPKARALEDFIDERNGLQRMRNMHRPINATLQLRKGQWIILWWKSRGLLIYDANEQCCENCWNKVPSCWQLENNLDF